MSVQMGLDPRALRKLQSCLVAAEAACSKGDFPVVTVETALTAVLGFATATVAAAVPAELATAVELLPSAINGAAQPVILSKTPMIKPGNKKADPSKACDLPKSTKCSSLLTLTNNVKYSSSPRLTHNGFELAIWSFVI